MGADVQNDPDSIKTEFIRVIKDFSQYLSGQKEAGNTFLDISEESEALINNWGSISRAQDTFSFEGPETADVFIIDSEAGFFKGEGGALLIKIIGAMKLTSDSVFICNAGDARSVYKKIKTISPKVIITLGTRAGQSLLNIKQPLEKFRGKFHEYHGIKVMPTFHPSLLLKQPEYKRQVWEDMKLVMKLSGLKDGS
ncbi:uracil-DNA glycosylase [Desulfobacula sp.]|uniref:uracil-DNA glycosylase n=1 Tax=Desulfobacula sp. TaxID=2593537 RepID=UPI0026217D54|nr:uracil-DNA glycosylase [Desulfobacula sp.]